MPEQPIFRSGNYGVFVDGQRLQVLVEMPDRSGRPYWGSDYDHGAAASVLAKMAASLMPAAERLHRLETAVRTWMLASGGSADDADHRLARVAAELGLDKEPAP